MIRHRRRRENSRVIEKSYHIARKYAHAQELTGEDFNPHLSASIRVQPHPGNKHRRDLAEIPAPTERIFLWTIGREGAFLEPVQNKTIPEAQVEIELERAIEI
jgi:hypothetical protein